MRVLVTGAHGLLGRILLQQQDAAELCGCGRGPDPVAGRPYYQVDLGDAAATRRLLGEARPDWVINTAALTNVDQCETERDLARAANVELVRHLVQACAETGSGLVQISTDYVFDGAAGPYRETDPTSPLSHYGALKLESENLVRQGVERGLVVRTLWLYGYAPGARPNFVTWALETLSRKQRLRVFADQWGNPTYAHDLARGLLELCAGEARGVFHLGGASFMTRHELGLALARFFGQDAGLVEPIPTGDAGLKAARPLRSGLCTQALEARLGWRPRVFESGLAHMVDQDAFRRAWAHLLP